MSGDKKEVKAGQSGQVILKVMGEDNAIMQFKIKKHTPLRKLMNAYCDRAGIPMSAINFRLDGYLIQQTDTALSLELEDGETIEVYQQQTGGALLDWKSYL